MLQTILGSGGGIGIPLARELNEYKCQLRLVSRNPTRVNDSDELLSLDLADPKHIDKAIAGSDVVYVTVGFEYNLKVWQLKWPPFLNEVIESCKKYNTRLVFFDNMYVYDKEAVPFMTEMSKINPPSEKGKLRLKLHEMITREVEKGNIDALIARSADFYGPDNKNSALTIMVANNLVKGKKAQVLGDIDKIHTYTYTPDAAKATAILGNTPDAYNQVWHVPTTKDKFTTRQWIELIAKELNTEAKVQSVSKFMVQILGLFVPIMREFPEMFYQYNQDYIFDSSKFEKRFGIFSTKPADGVRSLVENLRKK